MQGERGCHLHIHASGTDGQDGFDPSWRKVHVLPTGHVPLVQPLPPGPPPQVYYCDMVVVVVLMVVVVALQLNTGLAPLSPQPLVEVITQVSPEG